MLAYIVVRLFPVGLMLLGVAAGYSQEYPSRPVRLVTSGVGGGSDFTARQIAPGISGYLGQQVIVDIQRINQLSRQLRCTTLERPRPGPTQHFL